MKRNGARKNWMLDQIRSAPVSFIPYMLDNWDSLGPQIRTHVEIVLTAITIAALLGIALGFLSARSTRFSSIATAITSTLLTIPSFALFGALTIWLGIGDLPVKIGLILYALLPIQRNTAAGLREIDPAVLEAARGMGMRPLQLLRTVELPLAMPLIVAGLRQATVLIVAIATVGAAVGSNNLGQPILEGIRGSNREAILSGVVPVAGIGLLADGILGGAQRLLVRGRSLKGAE
ncbi:MAG: ABC transporter permease [Dehalococcoidia bacterium]